MTPTLETRLQARAPLYLQLQRAAGGLQPTPLMNALWRQQLKRARNSYPALRA